MNTVKRILALIGAGVLVGIIAPVGALIPMAVLLPTVIVTVTLILATLALMDHVAFAVATLPRFTTVEARTAQIEAHA